MPISERPELSESSFFVLFCYFGGFFSLLIYIPFCAGTFEVLYKKNKNNTMVECKG